MMRSLFLLAAASLLFAPAAQAQGTPLTLDAALKTAFDAQPQLRQASASVAASEARLRSAQAPLQPQVSLSSGYQLSSSGTPGGTIGANISQLLYDFGQTSSRSDAADFQLAVQRANARNTRQQIAFNVRSAFFDTQAARVGVTAAREVLANQQRHFDQIQRMVTVGSRAPIDLALARKDRANAQLQQIRAESTYAEAKARLNQAMGKEGSLDFEVAGAPLPAVPGEQLPVEALLKIALETRPEVAALQGQVSAQEVTLRAAQVGNAPALRATAGTSLGDRGNAGVTGGVSLAWPVWNGGGWLAQRAEAEASLELLKAQADSLRQQIRLEIEQARLAIASGQEAVKAAGESLTSARKQLTLAEGRYETGVGNILELSDAQLAVTNAQTQQIQEEKGLSLARARLLKALGRP